MIFRTPGLSRMKLACLENLISGMCRTSRPRNNVGRQSGKGVILMFVVQCVDNVLIFRE